MNLLGRTRNHGSSTDEELMELVARRVAPAFDELYRRYSGRLLFYFNRMLGGDRAKAQDHLHDLFLKVVERPELFTSGRRFSTWIFSAAHNMCKNEYRRQAVRTGVTVEPDTLASDETSVLERIDRAAFANALAEELDRLDPEQRTTFLLRHHENLSLGEIGEIVGCPVGTVKSRLFNITRKLAERLDEYHPHDRDIDYERAR